MKNLTFLVLSLIIITLGCVKKTDNDRSAVYGKGEIIPLAVGNIWYYSIIKDSTEYRWECLITEKKSMTVVLPDSSKMVSDVYIRRDIYNSINGNDIDTSYYGIYKDSEGIVLVMLDDSLNQANYLFKTLNDLKIGWFDTISPGNRNNKCKGIEKIKTQAGTFDCIKYSSGPGDYYFNSYYSKGVGFVSGNMGPDRKWNCSLVSYKLK